MSKHLPATLGVVAMLLPSTALAKERSELEKSSFPHPASLRLVMQLITDQEAKLPDNEETNSDILAKERSALESASVKAATDCVAEAALKTPNIITLYREDRLDEVTDRIVLHSGACDKPLTVMRLLHDRLYGEGTGRRFLRDYLAVWPRAVGERIEARKNGKIGIFLAPKVFLVNPAPTAGLIKSPFNFKIRFETSGRTKIDLDSIVITYKKVPPIDLTQRLKPFLQTSGIILEGMEAPAGNHRIRVDIKDSDGRVGWTEFTLKVSK
jgi:hypothetical protein